MESVVEDHRREGLVCVLDRLGLARKARRRRDDSQGDVDERCVFSSNDNRVLLPFSILCLHLDDDNCDGRTARGDIRMND